MPKHDVIIFIKPKCTEITIFGMGGVGKFRLRIVYENNDDIMIVGTDKHQQVVDSNGSSQWLTVGDTSKKTLKLKKIKSDDLPHPNWRRPMHIEIEYPSGKIDECHLKRMMWHKNIKREFGRQIGKIEEFFKQRNESPGQPEPPQRRHDPPRRRQQREPHVDPRRMQHENSVHLRRRQQQEHPVDLRRRQQNEQPVHLRRPAKISQQRVDLSRFDHRAEYHYVDEDKELEYDSDEYNPESPPFDESTTSWGVKRHKVPNYDPEYPGYEDGPQREYDPRSPPWHPRDGRRQRASRKRR
jgi:hypothetical protein